MLVRMEKRDPLYIVGEKSKLVKTQWKTLGRFLKKLKIELPYNSATSTPGYMSERNGNTNSKRQTHPNVHSNIIYNCQNMEAT